MNDDELTALATDLRALRARWGEAAARAALADNDALSPDQRARVEALVFGTPAAPAPGGLAVAGNAETVQQINVAAGGNVGLAVATLHLFFGVHPPDDAEALLRAYLDALCERYRPLALSRLLLRERGGDERTTAPAMPLRSVYTALATDAYLPRERFSLSAKDLDAAITAANPEQVPPDRLRLPVADLDELREVATSLCAAHADARPRALRDLWSSLRDATPRAAANRTKDARYVGQWYEPELAVEAIAAPRARLILLGDPGSGKSTVLRYLVVCIAEALLAGQTTGPTDLKGWGDLRLPVPIFCPLGPVAKDLDDDPAHDLDHLVGTILRSVAGAGGLRKGLQPSLVRSWISGGVLLCFDGLDEVSGAIEPTRAGDMSRRERVSTAIHRLAQEVGDSRVVVTCRTRPYEQDRAWQFPPHWQVRRIAPFAFGQVRFFVDAWYAQSCTAPGAKFSPTESGTKASALLAAIPGKPGLQAICESPLLLTMVVLLHYNQKQLPDERAEVYEELVGLLLDRWEWVRSSEREPGRLVPFGERLELPQVRVRDLRSALNQIAYVAHCSAQDGRGVIAEHLVYDLLEPRFRIAISPERPELVKKYAWVEKVEMFLSLLVDESGLLQPDGDGSYVLPHLTFEEYLAACYLAEQQYEGLQMAHTSWITGGDRWREPLLLLMGCLRRENKHGEAKHWLDLLLDPVIGTTEKTLAQRQRDAVLTAACYADLGGRRYLLHHQHPTKVADIESRLCTALRNALEQPATETLLPLRIEAGAALGRLGDPRFPVEPDDWRRELGRRDEAFGDTGDHYWRYVRPGTYVIGGWEADEQPVALQISAFWLARFPLTVAQYAPFVAEGYGAGAERWWTPEGWKWKKTRTQPWGWDMPEYSGLNQPVIGVPWHEATAFCAWLTERLADVLPAGHVLRLPTEAEWEAAASFDGSPLRRRYPWGDDEPTPERAIYDASKLGRPAPVGGCPSGAAACGALDLAGNVWELTASEYRAYPDGSHQPQKDFTNGRTAWRGGSWYNDSSYVRCGARDGVYLNNDSGGTGFRVVLAPPTIADSR